jgi:hypothetical protein
MNIVALFSKRKAAEAEAKEEERLRHQARKDRQDAITGRMNAWLEQLESHRAPDSNELSDELLGRVGAPPLPVAANAQEANHALFMVDRAMARSFAQTWAERNAHDLILEIRDAEVAGDEEAVARLEHLASFWSSVATYFSRLG